MTEETSRLNVEPIQPPSEWLAIDNFPKLRRQGLLSLPLISTRRQVCRIPAVIPLAARSQCLINYSQGQPYDFKICDCNTSMNRWQKSQLFRQSRHLWLLRIRPATFVTIKDGDLTNQVVINVHRTLYKMVVIFVQLIQYLTTLTNFSNNFQH